MLSATIEELRSIALAATDASGYFAAMYARVTERIESAARDRAFDDGARMEAFARAFARWYVTPATSRDDPVGTEPDCWRASFDVAADPALLIVQHLLLGINAHVNHDLALTVVEVAAARGDLGSIRPDFNAVNSILAETYDELLADLGLVSRWATRASAIGGGDAFNFSLRVAREQAWRAAVAMHTLDDLGLRSYEAELDRLVTVLAHQITRPPRLVRPLVWLARRVENDDAPSVTRRLLGADA